MQLTTLLDHVPQGSSLAWPLRDDDVRAEDVLAPLPCQSAAEADLWFAERTADVERAKALCGPCPLRASCLAGAIARSEPWGVWGGEVFLEGRVVPRKRGRGRPPKRDVG
ncbi:WhiB family transcriptional regulator [Georgenia faecalis]|uniref:Transcriptional regulator WhiB n=1 Tax=Georgenia faecalis TaxID=2483799 RepID=A0ABV9D6J8_9MICO|nr:WhiB family transcriptional regulator [Georgenia faecalis]